MLFRAVLLTLLLVASARAGDSVADDQVRHAWVKRATASLEGAAPEPHFVAYREAYLAALDTGRARAISRADLTRRLGASRVVLLGDQHDNADVKRLAVECLRGMTGGGPVTLAIEFIQPQFQAVLDAYSAGQIELSELRERAYEPSHWSFAWRLYAPLFEGARKLGVRVVAVEPGTHLALEQRDAGIATAVRGIGGRVLVFYGSFHLLGAGHLADLLGADLTVTPSAQDRYWELARRHGQAFDLLELSPRVVFANLGSPLEHDAEALRELMGMFGYSSFDEVAHDHPALGPAPELP